MATRRPGKLLMAEVGGDAHDRGAQAVAAWLRDGGWEVVFTGAAADAEALAGSAADEDVDAIVLFGPPGADAPTGQLAAALAKALARLGWGHVRLLLAGGLAAPGVAALPAELGNSAARDLVSRLVAAARERPA